MSQSASPALSVASSIHAQSYPSTVSTVGIDCVPLKVMTFNIWEDGKCGVENVARVIHQEQAHVTGVQECRHGTLHALVDMLKQLEREDAARLNREPHDQFYVAWSFRPYGGLRGGRNQEIGMGVISRLPIVQVYTSSDCSDAPLCGCSGGTDPCHLCGSKSRLNACAVKIQAARDQYFRFVCCHLRSAPYGPYLFKENPSASAAELAAGADKDGQGEDMGWIIEKVLDSPLCEPSLPTILCGDLNIPSHLDWEESTLHKRGFGRATLWPMSHKLSKHGFIDVYREHHPDPVTEPGYTWPAKPAEETGFDSIDDRIDFLYARTPLTLLSAATQALKAQNALAPNPPNSTDSFANTISSPSPSQCVQPEDISSVHSFRSLTLPSNAVATQQSAFELLRLAAEALPPTVVSEVLGQSYSSDFSVPAAEIFAQRTHLIPNLSALFAELFSSPAPPSVMISQVASLHSAPACPAPNHPLILPAPSASSHLQVSLNSLSPPVSPLSLSFNSPSPQLSALSRSLSSSPVITKWRRLIKDNRSTPSAAPALQLPSAITVRSTLTTATPAASDQIPPALRHLFIDSCQNVTRSISSPNFWPSDHFAITAHLRLSAPIGLVQEWTADCVDVTAETQHAQQRAESEVSTNN